MLTIPESAKTYEEQAAFCYRAIEKLRLWHNEQGVRAIDGKIGYNDFNRWVHDDWEPRNKATFLTLHSLKGYDTEVPAIYVAAVNKDKKDLSVDETAVIKTMSDRVTLGVLGTKDTNWDSFIDLEKIPKLNVQGEPLDPVEDFTTYTEVDSTNILTVAAAQLDLAGGSTSPNTYIYKDKTAAYFSSNFTHTYQIYLTINNTGHAAETVISWRLANTTENLGDSTANLHATLYVTDQFYYANYPYVNVFVGEVTEGGSHYRTDSSINDYFYLNMYRKTVRDEAVGTYGTLYSYTYSDAARTVLINTNSIALHSKADFRYVYGISSTNDYYQVIGARQNNLDLGAAPNPGILKGYTGAAWVKEPLEVYTGGSSQAKPLKRWDGGSWITVDTTGV